MVNLGAVLGNLHNYADAVIYYEQAIAMYVLDLLIGKMFPKSIFTNNQKIKKFFKLF